MKIAHLDLSLDPGLSIATGVDVSSDFEIEMNAAVEAGMFEVGDLDQTPRAIFRPRPDYPARMARLKVSGSVTILFEVSLDGKVTNAQIEQFTHEDFAREVRRQVDQWIFQPGTRDGAAVPYRMRQTIEFQLP